MIERVAGRAQQPSERRRVVASAGFGSLVGGSFAFVAPWQLAVLAGWDAATFVLVGWIWIVTIRLDAADTKRYATRDDNSRAAARVVVVGACVASLIGVLLGILKARERHGAVAAALTTLSLLAVVLAWLVVHTVFGLRYAHRYYDIDGGIEFPGDQPPCYRDFAYLSFTVGMTFQVSDTNVSDPAARWLLLRHALLSYLFGAVIVALTINEVASLLG